MPMNIKKAVNWEALKTEVSPGGKSYEQLIEAKAAAIVIMESMFARLDSSTRTTVDDADAIFDACIAVEESVDYLIESLGDFDWDAAIALDHALDDNSEV